MQRLYFLKKKPLRVIVHTPMTTMLNVGIRLFVTPRLSLSVVSTPQKKIVPRFYRTSLLFECCPPLNPTIIDPLSYNTTRDIDSRHST